ncbi:acyl carrier protein [Sulfitobacter sp. PS-8MA]|uniref:acyl carrier protein n=1 Tax=Sulfitobacter sp. PS-8MA TaxID=3237707 RepID=UPI0034C6B564
MSTEDQVIAILAEQAMVAPQEVTPDSTLDALGIDSMGVVEVIFAIEETFDIVVPFNANTPAESGFDISTVRSIVAGVARLKAEQG